MASSEEELKNLLMQVKKESENAVLKLNIKGKKKKEKVRTWHLAPLLHDK